MNKATKELIQTLKEKRIQMEMSQYKLSKIISVSHTTVLRIEANEINPTLDMFVKLADALDYDVKLEKRNYKDFEKKEKNKGM